MRKHLTDSERLLLGKTHFALQQFELAADALAQVQGVTNENAEASYWLERTYQALGAEAYARLEESFPDSWRTHQLRAEGHALRRDLDNAFKEFQVALQLQPNVPNSTKRSGNFIWTIILMRMRRASWREQWRWIPRARTRFISWDGFTFKIARTKRHCRICSALYGFNRI